MKRRDAEVAEKNISALSAFLQATYHGQLADVAGTAFHLFAAYLLLVCFSARGTPCSGNSGYAGSSDDRCITYSFIGIPLVVNRLVVNWRLLQSSDRRPC
jgi:hypothetical protein